MKSVAPKTRFGIGLAVFLAALVTGLIIQIWMLRKENRELKRGLEDLAASSQFRLSEPGIPIAPPARAIDQNDINPELLRLRSQVALLRAALDEKVGPGGPGPASSEIFSNQWRAWFAALHKRETLPQDMPTLLAALTNSDSAIKLRAITELQQIGLDRMTNTNLTSADLQALRDSAAATLPSMLPLLTDIDSRVRQGAAIAIGLLNELPTICVPRLIERLADDDLTVVAAAANALGRFRANAIDALPALNSLLQGGDENLRTIAGHTISVIQPQ